MSIFRDCDIRGLYGSEVTEDTAFHLGRAVGSRAMGQEAVVGGDLRPSTASLKAALIAGLCASGASAAGIGQVPTPAFCFARRRLGAYAGVMVTASHNPARYNGFKVMLGKLPVVPEDVQSLAQQMAAQDYTVGQGRCRAVEVLAGYRAFLDAVFSDLTPRSIVVDAGNGSMGTVAPPVLRRAGQHVEELFCDPDGTFPHRDPNPAVARHLSALSQCVLTTGAELGVAYDGDGDRVIFVDERGRVQPADRTLVLFIRALVPGYPGTKVVYDLKSSSVVAEAVEAAGGQALMEKSGHAFIKRRLLTEGALLAGEISGHYFFGALGDDDALYATLLMLCVLDELGMSLGAAMDTVPAYPITPDLRLPCPPEQAQRILDELRAAFGEHPVSTLDGVRIAFPGGWALARLSITEPLITLRFEARTPEDLVAIQRQVRARSPRLDQLLAAAGLP